jgi:hypothetical protein
MTPRTLLAHVAQMSTIQLENLATSALYFLLTRYPLAAQGFINLAKQAAPFIPDSIQFKTQARWEDAGIPDMVGTHSDVEVLLVESKFWAHLTSNQPVTYIKRLSPSVGGLLLFICPTERFTRLWAEITNRCLSKKIMLSATTHLSPGFQVSTIDDQTRLAILTWDVLLSSLESVLATAVQSTGVADVDQLRGLCERIDQEELKGLDLLDPVISGDQWKQDLNRMVDDIVDVLVARSHGPAGRYRATPGQGYYKRYMTFHGMVNWCVEWNLEYLGRFGQSCLWLTTTMYTTVKARLLGLASLLQSPYHFVGNQLIIPLGGADGLSRSELLIQILNQVEEVALHLESTSPKEDDPQHPTTR